MGDKESIPVNKKDKWRLQCWPIRDVRIGWYVTLEAPNDVAKCTVIGFSLQNKDKIQT